eukprot:751470-Hanusia_phi.AAC.4
MTPTCRSILVRADAGIDPARVLTPLNPLDDNNEECAFRSLPAKPRELLPWPGGSLPVLLPLSLPLSGRQKLRLERLPTAEPRDATLTQTGLSHTALVQGQAATTTLYGTPSSEQPQRSLPPSLATESVF